MSQAGVPAGDDGTPKGQGSIVSVTAQRVAAYRLGFDRPIVAGGDAAADDRLTRDVAADVRVDPNSRMAHYLNARTAAVDTIVTESLTEGVTQVVIIGAGYDARAWRFATPGVRWIEVDLPSTQADKRARLGRLGIDSHRVSFVACDLVTDDLPGALAEAGFNQTESTLFVCEGVIVYLEPAAVAHLLATLRALAGLGSRLALTARTNAQTNPQTREAFEGTVGAMGEPARLGETDIHALLACSGWITEPAGELAQRIGFVSARPG